MGIQRLKAQANHHLPKDTHLYHKHYIYYQGSRDLISQFTGPRSYSWIYFAGSRTTGCNCILWWRLLFIDIAARILARNAPAVSLQRPEIYNGCFLLRGILASLVFLF